jgi:hypothetical protein
MRSVWEPGQRWLNLASVLMGLAPDQPASIPQGLSRGGGI